MDRNIMLSYLRNPYGIDELERLYKIEKGLKDIVSKIENHNNGV